MSGQASTVASQLSSREQLAKCGGDSLQGTDTCQVLELSRLKVTVYLEGLKHPHEVSPSSLPTALVDNLLER